MSVKGVEVAVRSEWDSLPLLCHPANHECPWNSLVSFGLVKKSKYICSIDLEHGKKLQPKENQTEPCGSDLHEREQSSIMDNDNDVQNVNSLLIRGENVIDKQNKLDQGKVYWTKTILNKIFQLTSLISTKYVSKTITIKQYYCVINL